MKENFWQKIHPIVYLGALYLLIHICCIVYQNNIKIESQLQKQLNDWVWKNGDPRYKNAVGLSILSVTKNYASGCKTYHCSFITIVKNYKGELKNCQEGTVSITKLNKVGRRLYGVSDKYLIEKCEWYGPVKTLEEYSFDKTLGL